MSVSLRHDGPDSLGRKTVHEVRPACDELGSDRRFDEGKHLFVSRGVDRDGYLVYFL